LLIDDELRQRSLVIVALLLIGAFIGVGLAAELGLNRWLGGGAAG
jgi:hypothetical protein